ncbi:MAG: cytochrome b/b6 domain-containing protein [Planctomycetes bacterium]|nr:cytochrome b/b6 domain-containing protein [Planctomycetota bacterium]
MKKILLLPSCAMGIIGLFLVCQGSVFASIADEDCIACHSAPDLCNNKTLNLQAFQKSVHKEIGCNDCHQIESDVPHPAKLQPVRCETCHDTAFKEYSTSAHGVKHEQGDMVVAYCKDCHGTHDILPKKDPASTVNHVNLPKTCAKCHEDQALIEKYNIPVKGIVQGYQKSVHGKALMEKGLIISAVCTDCHSYHNILPPDDPKSTVYKKNIQQTCGSGKCHIKISRDYAESVHGFAVKNGNKDAPTCNDCHGEHLIRQKEDPKSPVSTASIATVTCAQCHRSEKINTKYEVSSDKLESYYSSYHGLASRVGDLTVANCASCHGIHNIKKSSDSSSTINPDNLPQTCGQENCHPGATANFTKGTIHKPATKEEARILFWIQWIYVLLIIGTIGGMLMHNGLDYFKKLSTHWKNHNSRPTVERFSLSMRIQHIGLLSTFSILAITGFALKYPSSFIGYPFRFIESGENIRSFIHRASAAVFTVICIYHVYFLLLTKRGRKELVEMMPVFKDFFDSMNMMFYYFGLQKAKPQFFKYGYVEKAEYWALIWGSVVMVVTGCFLWFENTAMLYFPKWIVDVAELVHLCEAILATLAIIVWHLYHVIINPDVYPISWVWLSGRMDVEELKHKHGMEYDKLSSSGEIKERSDL